MPPLATSASSATAPWTPSTDLVGPSRKLRSRRPPAGMTPQEARRPERSLPTSTAAQRPSARSPPPSQGLAPATAYPPLGLPSAVAIPVVSITPRLRESVGRRRQPQSPPSPRPPRWSKLVLQLIRRCRRLRNRRRRSLHALGSRPPRLDLPLPVEHSSGRPRRSGLGGDAHALCDASREEGAIVVVRPDSRTGTAVAVSGAASSEAHLNGF